MPALIGSLYVSLTADFAGFSRNITSADKDVATSTASMRRNIGLTERSLNSFQRTASSNIRPGALIAASRAFDSTTQRANLLRGALFATTAAFGGLGAAALTSNVVSRYLDTFTSLQNQIRSVSTDTGDLAAQFSEVQKVADRSRSSLSAVATLYSRLARAAPTESQDKLLRRVETINKALQIGGATAQESASAVIQFSQAIQSNRLGGDELRAVLETPLGGFLAKGMGISIGQLRKLSVQGKLTSDVVLKALDSISAEVDGKFAKSFETIDQALTKVDNKLVVYAGSLNEAYGVTKLITGAIDAFGNNLQTIIPVISSVAGLFGLIFAGRLAASPFQKIAAGIMSIAEARKEDMRAAQEQDAAAQRAVATAQKRVAQAKSLKPEDVAPAAFNKAVQREQAAADAAEKERLANIRKEGELRQQLADVTAKTSVASVKASNAVIDAENRLNASLGRRKGLIADRTDNRNAIKTLSSSISGSVSTLGPDVVAQQNKLVADRQRIAGELATIDETIARNREVLATRTAKAAALETAAEREAAAERIALAKQIQAVQAQGAMVRARAQMQAGRVETARGAMLGAGGAVAADAVKQTAGELYDAEKGAARTAMALSLAAKEAGTASIAFGVLRAAGGGLVSFLGGPWGVAFTAAIGFLTYLGISAQENAQKVAAAQQAIADGLAMIGADTGSEKTANESAALLDAKISAVKAQIEKVTFGMEDAAKSLTDKVNGSIFTNIQGLGSEFDKIGVEFEKVQQQFREGGLTFEQWRQSLIALGADPTILDSLIKSAGDAKLQFTNGLVVAYRLEQQLKKMDGLRAEMTVKINLDDPSGIFPSDIARGRSRAPGDIKLNDLDPLGGFRSAPQDLQPTDYFRQQILARAQDQSNPVLNTPQKIKDRTQALFEEGQQYGLTMEQAKKLATEELNIAEAQRKAQAQTKSATKDFEKFADKLRELKETGAASGLSEIDRQVVQFATSLKDGSKMMAQYIAAVKSGDMTKAPAQLLEARAAFIEIAAANQARDIVQKYGTGAQVTAMFAEQQEILNKAVADGTITAGQASIAYADFISQFGQYQWINQVGDAFSNFANSVIDDFSSIEDAALSLVKNLAKILINATLIQPFEDWLKGALGQAVGTANSGGSTSSIIGSLVNAVTGTATQSVSNAVTSTASSSLSAAAKAIQAIESGGNYGALGPVTSSGDRAYGAYQVMGANIPSWTQMALGKSLSPDEFLKNPSAQDAVFNKIFGANAAKYGQSDAASIWFSGRPLADAGSRSDQLGTTTQAYVDKFNKNVSEMGDTAAGATKNIGTMSQSLVQASQSIVNGVNLADPNFAATADPNGFANMLGIAPGNGTSSTGAGGGIFGSIFSGISKFIQGITDTLGNILGGLFGNGGILSGLLSGIGSIFGFAGGTRNASPGWHFVGENGPELLKFAGGEKVAPLGKLQSYGMSSASAARMGNGGGNGGKLKIEFEDKVGVQRRVESSSGPDGDTLRIMIEKQVDSSISSGRFDKSFGGRYGAAPMITKR